MSHKHDQRIIAYTLDTVTAQISTYAACSRRFAIDYLTGTRAVCEHTFARQRAWSHALSALGREITILAERL